MNEDEENFDEKNDWTEAFETQVSLKKYSLNELTLDNLASEFFGKTAAVSGKGTSNKISVLFARERHKIDFENALEHFKLKTKKDDR